jgi:hypothetical protein
MRLRSFIAFGILAFVSLQCSSSSSGTNDGTGVSPVLQSKCSQMCEHLVAAPLSGCGKSDGVDVATCKPECIDHVSAHGAEPPEATESDLDCAISAADCEAWKNCGDLL